MDIKKVLEAIMSFKLEIITIKVRCTKCGNTWGIRLDNPYTSITKFYCEKCKE